MDQFQQLRSTILGATNPGNGAPTPVTGDNPALQKFYDVNYQLPLSSAGVGALSAQDSVTVANQKQAEKEAREKEAQRLQDSIDPAKYQRVPKEDGGFAYLDGAGNEVSASKYAQVKGITSADAVKDSQNPIDIQYQNDFNNLQDFLNAVTTGDKETVDAFYKAPGGQQLRKLSPQEVIQKFKQSYPTVFGSTNTGQKVGSTFIPNSAKVSKSLSGGSSTSLADLIAASQGR